MGMMEFSNDCLIGVTIFWRSVCFKLCTNFTTIFYSKKANFPKMSQCTTATITTSAANSSARVTFGKIVDRTPKGDKNGNRMPKGDKNCERMPKNDEPRESSRVPKNDPIQNNVPRNEHQLNGNSRMPNNYCHHRIKRATSNDPNRMPNETMPSYDLDDQRPSNCSSSEYQHSGTVSEFSFSMALPMPTLAPSSSASSSTFVTPSDSFSTIRRNCERHMRRLERYKKARSFCSLDTTETEEEKEDNKNGTNANATLEGNDENRNDQRQDQQISRTQNDDGNATGAEGGCEPFETLRAKMLSLMENDMLLLAKLLQLGETLCELRSKHEQNQQQQQQNQLKFGHDGEGQMATSSSPNWTKQQQKEKNDGGHGEEEDERRQQPQHGAFLDDEEEEEEVDVICDTSAPRSLLHRARQHRRRAPLPPEFGRPSPATVSRVYLAGEQQTNDANRRGVPNGVVGSDQEDNDEEDDDQISPNVQYFSRKNSVLRIPIPPRASNRNFGRPKLYQRLNSSNFSSSSPSCCAGAGGPAPLVVLAAQTKMPTATPSVSKLCDVTRGIAANNGADAAHQRHHHHNGTATPAPPPSTIVETDMLMMDSGHSSASSEADPQQHSPPGAPSSRFSTFSSSLSTGSASSRSLFAAAAMAAAVDAAKRTKSEERHADGRGGAVSRRATKETEAEDEWKTNCNGNNDKGTSFSD